jgi:hypothetical protein
VDVNGTPYSGALLYLYQASTSIPANSYSDFGLSLLNPNPLACDAAGTIPQFWLADGAYRARMTNASGSVVIFDFDSIQTIGPSTGTGGGAGGSAVDPTAIAQTGDVKWIPAKTIQAGWVRLNGLSMGSVSSGATERANADVQDLYVYCWNNFGNTECPVVSGRGATGLSDFNANKAMALLDMRATACFGLNDMGNSNGGWLTSGAIAGAGGGNPTKLIAQGNLPNFNLSTAGLTVPVVVTTGGVTSVTHGLTVGGTTRSLGTGGNYTNLEPNDLAFTNSNITVSATASLVGALNSGGSGTAMDIMPFYIVGTFLMKL